MKHLENLMKLIGEIFKTNIYVFQHGEIETLISYKFNGHSKLTTLYYDKGGVSIYFSDTLMIFYIR